MKEFLNTKSNLTPGILGGLCMLLSNTIIRAFSIQSLAPYVVLVLSFLLGTTVFTDKKITFFQKCSFYVLNSLIVFSVALGTNTLGDEVVGDGSQEQKIDQSVGFFFPWF